MLRIALTGGIGSGKSTVSKLFAKYHIPIIEADEIVRHLLEEDHACYTEIVTAFGDIVDDQGQIDRRKLRNIVFNDKKQLKRLENIIHPRTRDVIIDHLSTLDAPYCIIVLPILEHRNQYPFVDYILVVDAPETLQIERAIARDKASTDDIKKIISHQIPRKTRLALADDIVNNDKKLEDLEKEIEMLHERYTQISIG